MDTHQLEFDYWFSMLQKFTLTPTQVELIQTFSDSLRINRLERFQRYKGRDPIRKVLDRLAQMEVNEEEIAQFKRYAQTCTANNSSY